MKHDLNILIERISDRFPVSQPADGKVQMVGHRKQNLAVNFPENLGGFIEHGSGYFQAFRVHRTDDFRGTSTFGGLLQGVDRILRAGVYPFGGFSSEADSPSQNQIFSFLFRCQDDDGIVI